MKYTYDHFGIPVKQKHLEMIHYPEFHVWSSDYEKHPYRIEWIFFEPNNLFHPLIQTVPHVCFLVSDIDEAIRGKKVLYYDPHMAFIEENGTPIEFLLSRN